MFKTRLKAQSDEERICLPSTQEYSGILGSTRLQEYLSSMFMSNIWDACKAESNRTVEAALSPETDLKQILIQFCRLLYADAYFCPSSGCLWCVLSCVPIEHASSTCWHTEKRSVWSPLARPLLLTYTKSCLDLLVAQEKKINVVASRASSFA